MTMTHRERLETAWAFQEADRVPFELELTELMRQDPRATRLIALVEAHADNFISVPGATFGFFGFPTVGGGDEVLEEQPGVFTRIRHTTETAAGTFTAVTYHPHGHEDYHWEERYITTTDDLRRLAETPREPMHLAREAWTEAMATIGEQGVPFHYLFHPLGALVRQATMEDVYTWFFDEPALVHRYLEAATTQLVELLARMLQLGMGPTFISYAHEMFIPPWMGTELYDAFVMPYDRRIGAAIRQHGGRWRAHCHGRSMAFLERFADCGITAVEPLELPPTGDNDLAVAKQQVGRRMLLSGNIASERFMRMTPDEVRAQVQAAIAAGAPGGGFTLATSNGHGLQCTEEEMGRVIENCEVYLEAGLEYGQYRCA